MKIIVDFPSFFNKSSQILLGSIIKDTELFIEETWRKAVREELANRFLDKYQEIIKEIFSICEKNKIEMNEEKQIRSDKLNGVLEASSFGQEVIKIYSFEEIKELINSLI